MVQSAPARPKIPTESPQLSRYGVWAIPGPALGRGTFPDIRDAAPAASEAAACSLPRPARPAPRSR